MKNRMNIKLWLLDDHKGDFSGAHVVAEVPMNTKSMWKVMLSQFAELASELDVKGIPTDGLYIISSQDNSSRGITDLLITRVSNDPFISARKVTLPPDIIGLLCLSSEEGKKLGVVALNYRVFPQASETTLNFGVPVNSNVSPVRVSRYTKLALDYIANDLRHALNAA